MFSLGYPFLQGNWYLTGESDGWTVKTTVDGKPFEEGVFHYGGLISTGTGISVSGTKKPAEINVSVWVVEILATALAA